MYIVVKTMELKDRYSEPEISVFRSSKEAFENILEDFLRCTEYECVSKFCENGDEPYCEYDPNIPDILKNYASKETFFDMETWFPIDYSDGSRILWTFKKESIEGKIMETVRIFKEKAASLLLEGSVEEIYNTIKKIQKAYVMNDLDFSPELFHLIMVETAKYMAKEQADLKKCLICFLKEC